MGTAGQKAVFSGCFGRFFPPDSVIFRMWAWIGSQWVPFQPIPCNPRQICPYPANGHEWARQGKKPRFRAVSGGFFRLAAILLTRGHGLAAKGCHSCPNPAVPRQAIPVCRIWAGMGRAWPTGRCAAAMTVIFRPACIGILRIPIRPQCKQAGEKPLRFRQPCFFHSKTGGNR